MCSSRWTLNLWSTRWIIDQISNILNHICSLITPGTGSAYWISDPKHCLPQCWGIYYKNVMWGGGNWEVKVRYSLFCPRFHEKIIPKSRHWGKEFVLSDWLVVSFLNTRISYGKSPSEETQISDILITKHNSITLLFTWLEIV